ncbi:uncharacterized protein LOC134540614 [Bacillus rossius redtenbacheri]|uniref:uncharacterized protein LOC134540614 n=1 Tax=Bacillus rossius redtenbacheri TaxID=93214 RepID=UPI002FDD25D0
MENSDSELDKGESKNRGRKRKCNVKKWKRNVAKSKRARGEAYVGHRGKKKPGRQTATNCKCKKNCLGSLTNERKHLFLKAFNNIAEQERQDSYLSGLITVLSVARRRIVSGNKSPRCFSIKYKVRDGPKQIEVCKMGFCLLHGIGKKRVERIAKHMSTSVTPPTDGRGKYNTRANAIPENIKQQVDNHIRSFPRRLSHYSRGKSNMYYLSPLLNISHMYQMYLEKYEVDVHHRLKEGQKIKPTVTYDYYYRYFRNNFNYSFGRPRTDMCKTCDILENQINGATSIEEKKRLETEKMVHITKADMFYTSTKGKIHEAENNEFTDTLCFDYQQNMPLPKVPSSDAFYCRQVWMYNFCIYSAKLKTAHYYMYDECTAKKGSNEVISFLKHYFDNVLNTSVKKVYLFSDNCCAQNKNNA